MLRPHSVTATEPAPRVTAAAGEPRMLGRYRIDGTLGEGGMGMVLAGFDPELQRRVAIKVLRHAIQNNEARARLFREARAMARLAHPNVIVVHEVGTHRNRDFVAMELVEGGTLSDWLRTQPPVQAILDAFIAAGRGLAHAHAAGLVHRDFKPRNVLRSHTGRIVVTDFGLARDMFEVEASPLDEALPYLARGSAPELTRTGAVLGTPEYMAPEQWARGQLDGKTDQFAFCVSLFWALTGTRPFSGKERDYLTAQIVRGPRCEDLAKLPRALRPIILRGLAARREDRWPSMTALLDELQRKRRKVPLVARAVGMAALSCAAALVLLPPRPPSAQHVCKAAARDRNEFIDAVLAHASGGEAASRFHVDADACAQPDPPRMTLRPTPHVLAALALSGDAAFAYADAQTTDHCARTVALVAGWASSRDSKHLHAADQLTNAAERCGDDQLRARAALVVADAQLSRGWMAANLDTLEQRAVAAVQRVPQADLAAELRIVQAAVLARRGHIDLALVQIDEARATLQRLGHKRAEIHARSLQATLRIMRGHRTDLELARRQLVELEPLIAAQGTHETSELLGALALVHMLLGDVEAAHRAVERTRGWTPPASGSRRIVGRVVDRSGKPVAGAVVHAGMPLLVDGSGVLPFDPDAYTSATTAADGSFAILNAPPWGAMMAIHGAQRSRVFGMQDDVELRMEPTRKIAGRIPREQLPDRVVAVGIGLQRNGAYRQLVPVAADGTFSTDVAPTEDAFAVILQDLGTPGLTSSAPVALPGGRAIDNLVLDMGRSQRVLRVTVRSAFDTPIAAAEVLLLPAGNAHLVRMRELVAPPLHAQLAMSKHDDVAAVIDDVPAGELTACAVALPGAFFGRGDDASYRVGDMEMRCTAVTAEAKHVSIDAVPQRRKP